MTSTAFGVVFTFLSLLSDYIMVTDKPNDKKKTLQKVYWVWIRSTRKFGGGNIGHQNIGHQKIGHPRI